MAAPNRILALDLGTQTVGIAEFQRGRDGGLILSNYKTGELLGDPAVDSTRLAQAKMTIGEMVSALGYKGQEINYAVSAQSVFTRFVKLPSVGEDQVDQIVGFEAQQNVPFPINEVVWDYQLVDQGNSAEVEVVLVAIKSDLLDEINDAVEGSGLKTAVVDVSPMAIYNAYRYNYGDVPDCSLIIDVGARTTNLIFVEPRKVFSRSIPIGGTKVTEAIAKEFNEPFAAAEERKRQVGFVSLGGSYQDPDDPDVARTSKMIRNTMTRLHAEISRSIGFYRSQQHGSAPQRVYLSGGTSTLPYMREFFHEKLQLPVEFFNPLRNVQVASNLNVEEVGRSAHTLGETVGLALRGALSSPMELNLRPASVIRRQRTAEQTPYFLVAGLCLILALAGTWLYLERAAAQTQAMSEQLDQRIAPLDNEQNKINRVRTAIGDQEKVAAPLLDAIDDRQSWTRLVNEIHSRLPKEYVWITGYEKAAEPTTPPPTSSRPSSSRPGSNKPPAEKRPEYLVKGLYLENPMSQNIVSQFVDELNKSEHFEVDKTRLKNELPSDQDWAYPFSFPLVIKDGTSPEKDKDKDKAGSKKKQPSS
jgi:type IV pilus assembly protein PilM